MKTYIENNYGFVISMHHLSMMLSTKRGITIVRCVQMGARECYLNSSRKDKPRDINMVLLHIELVDYPKEGQALELEKNVEMVDVFEEWVIYDELDPLHYYVRFTNSSNVRTQDFFLDP